ncbi:helix-turn-helix domain-containing protein [Paenibacillus sp. FSL M7-0134]|uniref:helix-turn-helix domain-containing protein n=1 Tax=Paenibacillus sp. FSL M7-0134 TaxID=2954754 RepID=UPI0030F6226D
MSIQNNLAILMAKSRRLNVGKISQDTGISRTTLTAMKYDKTKGINYDTLEILCDYFNCEVSDIIQRNEGNDQYNNANVQTTVQNNAS